MRESFEIFWNMQVYSVYVTSQAVQAVREYTHRHYWYHSSWCTDMCNSSRRLWFESHTDERGSYLIQELMRYGFELNRTQAAATKNVCCAKSEIAVEYIMVQMVQQISLEMEESRRSGKVNVDFEAV